MPSTARGTCVSSPSPARTAAPRWSTSPRPALPPTSSFLSVDPPPASPTSGPPSPTFRLFRPVSPGAPQLLVETPPRRSAAFPRARFILGSSRAGGGGGPGPIAQAKQYVLRLFISLTYVTANVVDWQSGRVVVTASSVEKPLRDGQQCGRACNAKAATAVDEVLAMRLRVDGLAHEPIHVGAVKEVEKKGFKNRTKV